MAIVEREKRSLLLIGAGGHAAVVLDAFRSENPQTQVVVFADGANTENLLGLDINLGSPDLEEFSPKDWSVHVAIGNNKTRAMISEKYETLGYSLRTVQHRSAVISPFAQIDSGSAILPGAIVNARAQVGVGVIINSSSVVEHDCIIENYAHISPGAVLAGNCTVGAQTWIGAGAVLREGTDVGKDIIVGANALVHTALDQAGTYVGTPAKLIKKE